MTDKTNSTSCKDYMQAKDSKLNPQYVETILMFVTLGRIQATLSFIIYMT